MSEDTEALLARAAAAIAECRLLTYKHRLLLQDMTDIFEHRMIIAMKAASGLRFSEKNLIERYRRLTQS